MTRGPLWIGWSSKDPMDEVTCDLNDKVSQSCAESREEHFRQRNCKCKGSGTGMNLTCSRRRNQRDCRGTMEEVRSRREAGTKKTPISWQPHFTLEPGLPWEMWGCLQWTLWGLVGLVVPCPPESWLLFPYLLLSTFHAWFCFPQGAAEWGHFLALPSP